jgi:hypothetical protein
VGSHEIAVLGIPSPSSIWKWSRACETSTPLLKTTVLLRNDTAPTPATTPRGASTREELHRDDSNENGNGNEEDAD